MTGPARLPYAPGSASLEDDARGDERAGLIVASLDLTRTWVPATRPGRAGSPPWIPHGLMVTIAVPCATAR